MWQIILKLIAVYLLRNRLNQAKSNIQHDFTAAKENLASIFERHATQFKEECTEELKRISRSIIAFICMILAGTLTGLTALLWIFATAWNSQNRTMILICTIGAGSLIVLSIALFISHQWKRKALFEHTINSIESDWLIFKEGLANDHKTQNNQE
jgi:hypothetical protein